jgi:glycogen synthase
MARFIFTVIPGDEGLEGLDFMKQLAEERPGDVCVFPHRVVKDVFTALREGCSFMVMGSMYEPFGAASEAYLCGMPVVARATGGLAQQVAPHPLCLDRENVLSLDGRRVVKLYHTARCKPTGILYREQASFADEVEGWRTIIDCRYWEMNPKGLRTEDRSRTMLYQGMQNSAAEALTLATELYRDENAYAEMITNSLGMLKKFSWKKAVTRYHEKLYQAAFSENTR